MSQLTYQEALDFLYSFIDYGSERSDRYSPEVFELDRIKRFLARLDNPQWNYPAVHIAGTKGKGSVAAMIATTLHHAGYRTGLYTSPHLIDFTERIQIDRVQITPAEVAAGVARLQPLTEAEPGITTYELITALAFQHFADKEIDIGVFEVGLGGRLDSTNVVHPIVTVITSLSYDHTHLLGDSLAEIAGEKAGIIKQAVPTISAPQAVEAERVLQQVASEHDSELEIIGKDWLFELDHRELKGQTFRIWPAKHEAGRASAATLQISLSGDHQMENAAVAYAALKNVEEAGFQISDAAYRQGFRQVKWPGRFQILRRDPFVIVDSAHNGDSAHRLKTALDQYFPGVRAHLIFGASEDKDIGAMLKNLGSVIDRATMTQAIHPRAADPEMLKGIAEEYFDRVDCIVPVQSALTNALRQASPKDVILVTGSLFIVGEVLAIEHELPTIIETSPPGEVA